MIALYSAHDGSNADGIGDSEMLDALEEGHSENDVVEDSRRDEDDSI